MVTSWLGKRSLRTVLIVPFILQTVTAVALVGYLSYKNGQQAVEDLAKQLMTETSARIDARLDNYLQTPQQVVAANYLAWQQKTLDIKNLEAVRQQFLQQMQLHPLLAGIYFLNSDYETIGYGRIVSQDIQQIAQKITGENLPIGTLYLGESRKPNLSQRKFYIVNNQKKSKKLFFDLKFDYRNLSWYQQAQGNKKQSWSSITPYQAAPVLGMFAVAPIYNNANQLQAVFTANFALTDLSTFLNQLNFSPSGKAFILDHSGNLVATSTLEKLYQISTNSQPQPLPAINSQNVITRDITQQLKHRFGTFKEIQKIYKLRLSSEGKTLFVQVMPYQDEYGLDWLVVVAIPTSDFMKEIHENTYITGLLCLTTLMIAISMGLITAQFITKPILSLNAAAKNISQGEFIQLESYTNLKEIEELTNSFNQMTASLQDSFHQLKESEIKFATLLEAVPTGISVFDQSGQILMINKAGREIAGQGVISNLPVSSVGEAYQIYYTGTDQPYPSDQLPSSLNYQGKTVFVNDLEIHRADGITIPLEVWSTPVFDESKNLIYTIHAFVDITEQKKAQQLIKNYNKTLEIKVQERTEALQQTEAQINAFFTSAPVGMAIIDRQFRFVRVNETLAQIDELTIEKLVGQTIREAIPQLADQIEPLYQQVLTLAQPILNLEVSSENSLKPGSKRNWLVSLFPIFNANYRADEVGVLVVEISELKQAEAALMESEIKFSTIFHTSPDPAWISSLEERCCLTVNESLVNFSGYSSEEMIGKTSSDLRIWNNPEDQKYIQQKLREEGSLQNFEMDFKIRSGEIKTVLLSATVTKLQNQECVIGLLKDISDRKQLELALQQKTEELDRFFTAALDLLCIADTSGYFRKLSQQWHVMLGYDLAELEGCRFLDLVHPDDIDKTLAAITELSAQKEVLNFVNRYRHQDGSYRWLEWRSVPVGNLIYATARDITDRRQAEETLQITLARLQNLAMAAPGNIYSLVQHPDGSLAFEYTNQVIEEITEVKLENILQDAAGVILGQIHPDDIEGYLETMTRSQEFLEVFHHEWRIITPSGKLKWLQGNAQPERRENGDIVWHGILLDISARKFAEEAVQESAARLQSFFDSASMMMGIVELYPHNVLHIIDNRATAEFFGTTPEVIQNRFITEMGTSLEVIELWHYYYRQAERTDHHVHFEYCHQTAEGNKWLSVSVCQIANSASGRPQFSYVAEDISDRKATEVALRESEERFRNLFEHSPVAYQALDEQGCLLDVNDELCNLLGYTKEELLGRHFNEFWTSKTQPYFRKKFKAFKADGIVQTELHLVGSNGLPVIVLFEGRVQYDREGRFFRMHCVLYNFTGRKRSEQAIKAARDRLELVIRASQDGFWDWDLVSGDIHFSSRFKEMLGYAEDEFPNEFSAWEKVIFEEDRIIALKLVEDYNTGRVPQFSVTQRFHHKNGSTVYILSRAIHLKDARGNVIRMVGAHTDITNLKQTEEALQKAVLAADAANRAKSEFLASMSHELRTPLNAILGFSQIMSKDNLLSPENQKYIAIINRAGEHLLALINDILEVSKIEAGRTTFNETTFNLFYLLDGLEQMLQLKASAKGLQLIFEYGRDLPHSVKTDEGKLRQILLNLLGNAIKFTKVGAVILRVSSKKLQSDEATPTTEQKQTLYFEVEDTGPGISPEEMHFLFEAFGQTKTGRNSQQGTGLGLPISQKYVHLMGGEMTVRSIPDQGSIFAFKVDVSLPDSELESLQMMQFQTVTRLTPTQPESRILIVDDLEECRLFLFKLFTSIGFLVCEAENGEEAVQRWKEWQPDLILMDMKMPVMDGYEAVSKIRAEEEKMRCFEKDLDGVYSSKLRKKTVIFALTASAFEEQRENILSAGCDDLVCKPFQIELLLEKISQHLGVQYERETKKQPVEITQQGSEVLNDEDLLNRLSQMPVEWIENLDTAASGCSDDRVLELVEQIPTEHKVLANKIIDLAENFEFIQILTLTQKIIQ